MSGPAPAYAPGALVGKATILTRTGTGNLARVTYECACGVVRDVSVSAIYNRTNRQTTHCLSCRASYTNKILCVCTDCGRRLRRISSAAPTARCAPCSKKAKLVRKVRYFRATKGRRCAGCKRTDSETLWSGRLNACSACARTGVRNGFHSCGAPLWKSMKGTGRYKDRPLVCRAGCAADSDDNPKGDS